MRLNTRYACLSPGICRSGGSKIKSEADLFFVAFQWEAWRMMRLLLWDFRIKFKQIYCIIVKKRKKKLYLPPLFIKLLTHTSEKLLCGSKFKLIFIIGATSRCIFQHHIKEYRVELEKWQTGSVMMELTNKTVWGLWAHLFMPRLSTTLCFYNKVKSWWM